MCVKCVTCHYNKIIIIIIIIINAWSKTTRPSTRPSTQNDVEVAYNHYTRFHCTNNFSLGICIFINAICWYLIVSQYVLSRTVESTTTESTVSIV